MLLITTLLDLTIFSSVNNYMDLKNRFVSYLLVKYAVEDDWHVLATNEIKFLSPTWWDVGKLFCVSTNIVDFETIEEKTEEILLF